MSYPVAISDSSFENEVVNADKPVLVDFWAEWCGPCRLIAPMLEKLADEYAGSLKITKLDVDANPKTMVKLGVQSIPTLILFKGGEPVERMVGFTSKERLLTKIRPYLEAAATA